jgi:alpha-tubulin suppressor-like RCC1 family protein
VTAYITVSRSDEAPPFSKTMSDSDHPTTDRFGEPIEPVHTGSLLFDPTAPLPYDEVSGFEDGEDEPARRSRTPLLIALGLVVAVAGVGGVMATRGSEPTDSPDGPGVPAVIPALPRLDSIGEVITPVPSAAIEGPVGSTLPVAFRVSRGRGTPVADTLLHFSIRSGVGLLETSLVRTDSDGLASTRFTLPPRPGTTILMASFAGSEATNATITVRTLPGSVARIEAVTGDGQEALIGDLAPTRPLVRLVDAEGNPVPNTEVRFEVTEGGGMTAPTRTRTDSLGQASALWRLGMTDGAQRLEATSPELLTGVTFSASALPRVSVDVPSDGPLETDPVTVTSQAFAVGGSHVCTLRQGSVACRGSVDRGQAAAEGMRDFRFLTAGASHTCGIDANGIPSCWGANESGQLGDGSRADRDRAVRVRTGLRFSSLVAGAAHTCGLAGGGVPFCWGQNLSGQLGDGSRNDQTIPRTVGVGMVFRSLAAGWSHTCGLTANGNAFCWGLNSTGQLGNGGNLDQLVPTLVRGSVLTLVAGSAHTCGISEGAVLCWGGNSFGQLGDGTTENRAQPRGVTGLPGVPTRLAAGAVHTCALVEDGSAYCWGQNLSGQLGDGTTQNRATATPVSGGHRFTEIYAGGAQTCAITASGEEYCWGLNQSGQLGDGSRVNRSVPTRVAG